VNFPTTHWSLLAKATLAGETEARAAIETLYRAYWSPIRQFILSRGYSPVEADDLAQAFLMHLMERSVFRKADQAKGRFRSFLLGALVRFLGDERDHKQARKRGGRIPHESFDDQHEELSLPVVSAEETFRFDRAWALTVLRASLTRVRNEYAQAGQEQTFLEVRSFLPGRVSDPPSYQETAARLGITLSAFTSELHRLRQRVRSAVREEVVRTVAAPHEVEDEMVHLQKVLLDRGTDLQAAAES
jgi:RNA polymerase sigma factor (sigma-70 family)